MISLRLFLTVLVTLVCREYFGSDTELSFSDSIVAISALVLGFGLLVKFAAVSVLRRIGEKRALALEKFSIRRRVIEALWAGTLPLTLSATDWVHWINAFSDDGWPHSLALFLLFAPSLFLVALIEMTAAQLEELTQPQRGASSDWEDANIANSLGWGELWKLRLRLGDFANLLMCLLPVFLISGCTDLIGICEFGLSESQLAACATALAMVAILLVYPLWIGQWMGVEEIDGCDLSDRVKYLQQAVGVHQLKTVVVASHGRWNGAAVVGWFPRFRRLWLGDALVSQLTSEQLDMVILHELAHVKRMHFLWRSMPIVWASLVGFGYFLIAGQLEADALPVWLGQGLSIALSIIVLLGGLGMIARSCELEADRVACEMAESVCQWAAREPGRPAAVLASALDSILGGSKEASRRTWLHPSLRERLVSLASELATRRAAL